MQAAADEDSDLHFTTTTTSSSTTGGVPLAALPLLAPAVTAIPSTSTPSPTKKRSAPISTPLGPPADLPVASPGDFVGALLQGKPVGRGTKAGSAADRAAARRERVRRDWLLLSRSSCAVSLTPPRDPRPAQIQAKQTAQQQSAYHSSFSALSSGESSPSKRSLKRHGDVSAPTPSEDTPVTPFEQHKRNAMLSRLGSVADVVAMRCAGRPTPLEEVCTAVANSPLLNIGFGPFLTLPCSQSSSRSTADAPFARPRRRSLASRLVPRDALPRLPVPQARWAGAVGVPARGAEGR